MKVIFQNLILLFNLIIFTSIISCSPQKSEIKFYPIKEITNLKSNLELVNIVIEFEDKIYGTFDSNLMNLILDSLYTNSNHKKCKSKLCNKEVKINEVDRINIEVECNPENFRYIKLGIRKQTEEKEISITKFSYCRFGENNIEKYIPKLSSVKLKTIKKPKSIEVFNKTIDSLQLTPHIQLTNTLMQHNNHFNKKEDQILQNINFYVISN